MYNDKPKPKKSKYISLEYLIIFDDISIELKDKYLSFLIKKNRHYKMDIIISSQYYNDLMKDTRTNINYFILFPHITDNKLHSVFVDSDINMNYDLFVKLYKNVTSQEHNFLFFDTKGKGQFRKKFNLQYKIN